MIRSLHSQTFGLQRHSLRIFPQAIPSTYRPATLSSIHRGLQGSERAQYGEARPRDAKVRLPGDRGRRPSEGGDDIKSLTAKALQGAGSKRKQAKLLSKLKKKQDEEDGTGPKTRRRRFNDPELPFGKKSLVYQLKNGALQDLTKRIDEPVRPRSSFRDTKTDTASPASFFGDRKPAGKPRRGQTNERPPSDDFAARFANVRSDGARPRASGGQTRSVRRKSSGRDSSSRHRPKVFERNATSTRPNRSNRDEKPREPMRTFDRQDPSKQPESFVDPIDHPIKFGGNKSREEAPRDLPNTMKFERDSTSRRPSKSDRDERPRDRPRKFDRDYTSARPARYDAAESRPRPGSFENGVSRPEPRERRGAFMPLTIKYTTAASQFLYGKSVVKAALEQARRQLYHLYIYGGENRADNKDNTTISRLAGKRGVPITIVPNEDQRLMDKMSQGRPHNGFVLETSPLPQLPITALGPLEETPSRLGFHVNLGHQTREDEEVNGKDTFVKRSSNVTAKPFVLLLNEIIDPGNLGALLRTASYLGVDAVGITDRNSSSLTPVVLKSAAGAVEEITIFSVASPVKFIEDSRKSGWKSYAAIAPPDRKLVRRHGNKFISTEDIERQSPLANDPCILILGNEGYGLSREMKVAADYELSVPRFIQESCVDSLNVSVAGGLLCHAFVREPRVGFQSEPKQMEVGWLPIEKARSDSVEEDVMF